MNDQTKEQRFLALMGLKLAGELSPAEAAELELLLNGNKQWRSFHDLLLLQRQPPVGEDTLNKWDSIFTAHQLQMQLTGRFNAAGSDNLPVIAAQQQLTRLQGSRRRRVLAAAFVILALGFTSWLFFSSPGPVSRPAPVNQVATRKGSKSKITLPDGSRVQLNADSHLSYANFEGSQREVHLTGEAFFDVVKDSLHPFIIHTEKLKIRVLGTSFNVKAYPGDKLVETALVQGKIEVTFTDRPLEKLTLNPNEKLVLRNDQYAVETGTSAARLPKVTITTIVPVTEDSLMAETAWVENKLVFASETLENIALVLERRFDVSIGFASPSIKAYRYSGVFEQEALDRILEILSMSRTFSYTKQKNGYMLSK